MLLKEEYRLEEKNVISSYIK